MLKMLRVFPSSEACREDLESTRVWHLAAKAADATARDGKTTLWTRWLTIHWLAHEQ